MYYMELCETIILIYYNQMQKKNVSYKEKDREEWRENKGKKRFGVVDGGG